MHLGFSKLGEPRSCSPEALALVHLQEALTDPGVCSSGDDALDLRVVGHDQSAWTLFFMSGLLELAWFACEVLPMLRFM